MYAKHAELKAGIVVVLGIAALLALLYVASGQSFWGRWRTVHVRFDQGLLSPKEDDPVHMNGVRIGRVDAVELRSEVRRDGGLTPEDREALDLAPEAPGVAREIYVHAALELEADVVLPEDTYAEIKESITGAVDLHLIPGRSERDLTDAATVARPLRGVQGVGLADIARRIDELIKDIETVVGAGGGAFDDVKEILSLVKEKVKAFDVTALSDDARAAVASLRRVLDGIEPRIARAAENVEAATEDVRRMAGSGAKALDGVDRDLDELLATLKQVAARLDRVLAKAEPKVDVFLDSLVRAGARLETLAKDFGGLGTDAQAVLREVGADVGELVSTLNDAAHNVLDASEDIRSRPWILLNEPEPQEIAFDNVRIATQNYARAMADMNRSAERLAKLATAPNVSDPEVRALLREAVAQFRLSQDRYQRVEATLLRALQQTAPGAAPAPARPPR